MIRLASIIDTFEADFRAQYQDRLTADHLRALAAMQHCRSHASPKMQVRIVSITKANNGWNGRCNGWCRLSIF